MSTRHRFDVRTHATEASPFAVCAWCERIVPATVVLGYDAQSFEIEYCRDCLTAAVAALDAAPEAPPCPPTAPTN